MKSRAQQILSLFELVIHGYNESLRVTDTPPSSSPHQSSSSLGDYAPHLYGAFAGITAASIASQMNATNKRIAGKVRQAGLGDIHRQAKKSLRSMQAKHNLTLRSNPGLGLKIQSQKRKVKEIENRGLERYHKGQLVNPSLSSSPPPST